MLPTFVIGLREGLEAALIVGIVAAFLRARGRTDALRWVALGVGAAVCICAIGGTALELASRELPQKQQEGLETVIGLVAVAAVSWMVLWMRRNARALKQSLEHDAAGALASGSVGALVGMAFFAVIREGFETVVFLIAAFDASTSPLGAGGGAGAGILVAVAIGYGIYRGGVRINLARFFRATGVVLVLVAAGLCSAAVHTAHEAGWWNGLQSQAVDLSWLVAPGSVRSALLTGMLGLQSRPTVGESAVYLVYLVPMLAVVLWPRRGPSARAVTAAAVLALVAVLAAGCGGKKANSSLAGARSIDVVLTKAGCPAKLQTTAGPTTFRVSNSGASAISEFEVLDGDRILGEAENLAPGLSGHFSLTLEGGTYTTSCPGGRPNAHGVLAVTGAAAATSQAAAAAVARYRTYVEQQSTLLVERTRAFTTALGGGELAAAKRLYAPARIPYERIEPIAESFGNLDPAIDARAGDVPPKSWTGFHPIERLLWIKSTTAGTTALATKLTADVATLRRRIATIHLQPAQVANGAVELLDEVSKSKITGEEERYSHVDLDDFAANVDGSRAAFNSVRPLVASEHRALAQKIDARFRSVEVALRPYRSGGGYVFYTTLTPADTRRLSQAIDSLAEPLSSVAGIVAAAR